MIKKFALLFLIQLSMVTLVQAEVGTSSYDVHVTNLKLLTAYSSKECSGINFHKEFSFRRGDSLQFTEGHILSPNRVIIKNGTPDEKYTEKVTQREIKFPSGDMAELYTTAVFPTNHKNLNFNGLAFLVNWVDSNGKPIQRKCLFSFKSEMK